MKSKTTKLSMILILVLIFSNLAIREVKGNQDHFTELGSGIITSTYDPYGSPVQNNNFVSNSYYMDTTDVSALYNLGYNEGQSLLSISGNQDEVVILDFGDPYYIYPQYGTLLVEGRVFRSTSEIASAVEAFAHGFFDGDTNRSDKITILIGTNNCCTGTGMVTIYHGQAWGSMVNSIYSFISYNYDPNQIYVAGASDIEMLWSDVATAVSWVQGYYSQYPPNYMYNFGSADGCPQIPSSQNESCANLWTKENVYQISSEYYHARPLPEIYAVDEANAKQWYCLSYYSKYVHQARLDIRGTLTQYQACIQRSDCYTTLLYNNPSVGSQQLYKWLHQDPGTGQSLYWNTDIQHGTGE